MTKARLALSVAASFGVGAIIGFALQPPQPPSEVVHRLLSEECEGKEVIMWDISRSIRHADENFQFIKEIEDVPESVRNLVSQASRDLSAGYSKAREMALVFRSLCGK